MVGQLFLDRRSVGIVRRAGRIRILSYSLLGSSNPLKMKKIEN
jgi:hypothetical protein